MEDYSCPFSETTLDGVCGGGGAVVSHSKPLLTFFTVLDTSPKQPTETHFINTHTPFQ